MPHDHGLKIQNLVVDDVDLSTLAARTMVAVNTAFASTIESTFLVKKIKMMLRVQNVNDNDGPLIACLAPGSATVAEAALALTEINTVGPIDRTQILTEDTAWTVWQNTVRMFEQEATDGTNSHYLINKFISLGRGMPALENEGLNLLIGNISNNPLTTAALVSGIVQLWGVWLRD